MEERKLKPIYDELERSRPKAALIEIERYQKRYPKQANAPIIAALKCVALQRQRDDDEAYATFLTMVKANSKGGKNGTATDKVVDSEIPDDVVIDESTLHTLGYALRPMRKIPQLMKLYQNAWTADPENLELGVQVFQHAIRIHDWRTMQQASIKLMKASQDARTAQWAAMSSYLEACQPETPEKQRNLLLALSRSLLEREPSSPYQNEDTLLLYIKILRGMAGDALIEALTILTPDIKTPFQPDGQSSVPAETQRIAHEKESRVKRDTVKKWMTDLRFRWERWEMIEELAGEAVAHSEGKVGEAERVKWNWEEEFVRGDDLIRGAEDTPVTNYKAYLTFISSLMVLLSRDDGQTYLSTARETLDGLTSRFGNQERAPLLAQLEINRRLRQFSDTELPSENHSDDALLSAYWTEFGHKGSVLDDLSPYVGDRPQFIEILKNATRLEAGDYKEYIRQLNAYKLLQLVTPQTANGERRQVAKEQFKLYLSGARFGQGLPSTDVKPADDFALLSAQGYVTSWASSEQRDLTDLLMAIFVLEKVVKDSPANGHARILLLRLYRMIAAPSLLPQHMQQLKMRTFQQDTVLHMVTERSSSDYVAGGEKGRAMISKLLLNSKGIYESTEREVSEAMVSAYTAGSYSQIPGMLKLSQRFGNSHHRFLGELELVRQSALRDHNELTNERAVAVENIDRDKGKLEDLRDWDLLPDYLGRGENSTLRQQTATGPLTDAAWVRIMSEIWIRVLDPDHQKSSAEAEKSTQITEMEQHLVNFANVLIEFAHSCKAGVVDGAADVKGGFLGLISAASAVPGAVPWDTIHSWSTVLEAFAMMEIALSPYKPLSGKKAKKGQSSKAPSEIGEAVKAILVDSKAALKTLAGQAASLAIEDKSCPSGILTNALKQYEFAELAESSFARQCETSVRDSRRIAFKEMAKEFKRRADN